MKNIEKKRRNVARFLLPFVMVWMCLLPSRSYALLPGPIALIVFGGDLSAGGTVVAAGAAQWGLLLGAVFAFIGISDSNGNQVRLPLTADPSKGVPAPDAAGSASSISGWSWSQGPGTCAGGSSGLTKVGFASLADALTDWVATATGEALCSPATYTYSTNGTQICYSSGGGAPFCYMPSGVFQNLTSCPAGYILSGSACVLENARVASPDAKCDYARAASALAVLSDPDCGGGGQLVNCNTGGTVCSAVGTNPVTGQPQSIEIRTNPDGGSTIVQREQALVGNTTVTDSTTVAVSSSGTVTSVTGTTNVGALPTPGGEPTGAQVTPSTTPTTTPITFPSDYARTGEAATAAQPIGTKLDVLHNDLTTTVTVVDPVEPLASDMPSLDSSLGDLKAFNLPVHASTCPAPSLDLSGVLGAGRVYQFDAHCQLVQNHFAALQASMMVCWSLLALFVVLRA